MTVRERMQTEEYNFKLGMQRGRRLMVAQISKLAFYLGGTWILTVLFFRIPAADIKSVTIALLERQPVLWYVIIILCAILVVVIVAFFLCMKFATWRIKEQSKRITALEQRSPNFANRPTSSDEGNAA